jgi:hypothetical protein
MTALGSNNQRRLMRLSLGIAASLASLALTGCDKTAWSGGEQQSASLSAEERKPLGLMTSLPIYWPEAPEFDDLLAENAQTSWVRGAIEQAYAIQPLDVLDEASLAPLSHLILAQPRALSGAENVALDAWVQAGGRVLIFADPMLTQGSAFAFGDSRRPLGVALLSPILARWGLELTFDDQQSGDVRVARAFDMELPVKLAGAFRAKADLARDEAEQAQCDLGPQGIVARCVIGAGFALIIADAALLEEGGPEGGSEGDHSHGSSAGPNGGDEHDERHRPEHSVSSEQRAAFDALLSMAFNPA